MFRDSNVKREDFWRARTVIGVVVYSKIIRTITVHRREEHQRFEYVVFYYA